MIRIIRIIITSRMIKNNGGARMGKVTIELDKETHLKLKLICTTRDEKIKDYAEKVLVKQIGEDYESLDMP